MGSERRAPRRDPDRRRALLEAADRIIQREGPEASMATIATEAGISKPILYRHFGDKSGLYQALADRHTRSLVEAIREEFEKPGSIRDRVGTTIDLYLSRISENLNLYHFLMHRASAEDTATHSAMSTVIRGLSAALAELLIVEGAMIDHARAHVWGHAVIGMVQNVGDWWLDHPEVPRRTVVDGLADLIVDGLPQALGVSPVGADGGNRPWSPSS